MGASRDMYAKGWVDGVRLARRLIMREKTIEEAVARLEELVAQSMTAKSGERR